jgi:hypothetical protein
MTQRTVARVGGDRVQDRSVLAIARATPAGRQAECTKGAFNLS